MSTRKPVLLMLPDEIIDALDFAIDRAAKQTMDDWSQSEMVSLLIAEWFDEHCQDSMKVFKVWDAMADFALDKLSGEPDPAVLPFD